MNMMFRIPNWDVLELKCQQRFNRLLKSKHRNANKCALRNEGISLSACIKPNRKDACISPNCKRSREVLRVTDGRTELVYMYSPPLKTKSNNKGRVANVTPQRFVCQSA